MVLDHRLIKLKEIVDAVGGKIDIICDGGIKETHILKAISKGANACWWKTLSLCTCIWWKDGVEPNL